MSAIIDEIFKALNNHSCLYEEMEFSNECGEESYDDIYEAAMESNIPFEVASGASKYVIIPNDGDEVIKIPFNGQMDESYNDEGKYEDYIFFPFECAGVENGWDYCQREVVIADAAEEEELEQCFAITRRIGLVNGYPIYAQEKAEVWSAAHDYDEYSEEKKSTTSEKCKQLGVGCFNSCWLSDFLDYFGEDIFQKFMKFIDKQNIGDLHSDNIGYIGNRPVLIDYSGYWD